MIMFNEQRRLMLAALQSGTQAKQCYVNNEFLPLYNLTHFFYSYVKRIGGKHSYV